MTAKDLRQISKGLNSTQARVLRVLAYIMDSSIISVNIRGESFDVFLNRSEHEPELMGSFDDLEELEMGLIEVEREYAMRLNTSLTVYIDLDSGYHYWPSPEEVETGKYDANVLVLSGTIDELLAISNMISRSGISSRNTQN
ncbi:MAG: hypothetical protein DRI61_15670, partial [Chloroflexi bacterium]